MFVKCQMTKRNATLMKNADLCNFRWFELLRQKGFCHHHWSITSNLSSFRMRKQATKHDLLAFINFLLTVYLYNVQLIAFRGLCLSVWVQECICARSRIRLKLVSDLLPLLLKSQLRNFFARSTPVSGLGEQLSKVSLLIGVMHHFCAEVTLQEKAPPIFACW